MPAHRSFAAFYRLHRAFTTPAEPNWKEIRAAILAGANPNAPSVRRAGQTLLTCLLTQRKVSPTRIRWLLEVGADTNLCDMNVNSDSPLMIAVLREQPATVVACLLDHGADPNIRNRNGWGPLAYAVWHAGRPTATVALLLASGADPNARTAAGQTVLSLAAACPALTDPVGLFGVLLAAGVNPSLTDSAGRTAPEIFADMGRHDLLMALDTALAQPASATARCRLLNQLTDHQQKTWLPRSRVVTAAAETVKIWERKP